MRFFTRLSSVPAPTMPTDTTDYAAVLALTAGATADLYVQTVARSARALLPGTPLREAIEVLRASPYRAVPVVNAEGLLLGLITERALAMTLLNARSSGERAQLLRSPARSFAQPPPVVLAPFQSASEAANLFAQTGEDTLPLVDSAGVFRGLVAPSDLVREMVRPFRPPTIGGLATPAGVYLTTGSVSGGVGPLALIASGLVTFLAQQAIALVLQPAQTWATASLSSSHAAYINAFLNGDTLPILLTTLLFLAFLRLTPIAGYHAAEHQVVHTIERGEPLLPDVVRAMPRVHPRCGTNLVAGLTLVTLGGSLSPLLGLLHPSLGTVGWMLGGIAALAWWRSLGGWVQQHLTTRPASDKQIESGLRAARELLARYSRAPYSAPRPFQRLWRMGFVQILLGYALGYALIALAARLVPGAQSLLGPLLSFVPLP